MKKKKIIIITSIIIVCIAIILILIGVIRSKKANVTDLERQLLIDYAKETMVHFEKIDTKNNGIEQYIVFAMENIYDKEGKKEVSEKEIINYVSEYFNVKLNNEKLKDNDLSPLLVENGITYDREKGIYTISKHKLSQAEIANTSIVFYLPSDVVKESDKYTIIYKKYIINNPYEILNYYSKDEDAKRDTSEILDYLKGKKGLSTIKKYITKDMLENIAEYSKDVKVTFIINDNKLLIDSVS